MLSVATQVPNTDIVCLCNYHGVGGAQLNAGMLTAEFRAQGYNAELGFLFDRERDAKFSVDPAFVLAPRAPRSVGDWMSFARACQSKLVARRPKVIIGFQPFANIVGAWAASRVPDTLMVATQRNPADRQSKLVGLLESIVGSTRLYHANIAVSETVASSFSRYPREYRGRLGVVYNATPPLPHIDETRSVARERLGILVDDQNIVLGCMARLHPQKNVGFALSILQLLPENVVLCLAGTGPDEAALRAKAVEMGVERRVQFLGSLGGADVTRFYRGIDILLFTSVYEGFGRVLVEAMSQGTPVISSDIPITREVGGEAALYRPFDPSAWVLAVRQLVEDPSYRASQVAAGIERAGSFTLGAMTTGYLRKADLLA